MALKVLGARTRRINQVILPAALDADLHAARRVGAGVPEGRARPESEKGPSGKNAASKAA